MRSDIESKCTNVTHELIQLQFLLHFVFVSEPEIPIISIYAPLVIFIIFINDNDIRDFLTEFIFEL